MRSKRDRRSTKKASALIVRREEAGGHAAHGGAWKVAYADFVTAMMAFFLLMWLMNATTEDQRKGLADYFSPTNLLSHNSSGTGQPFGGRTAFEHGALVSDRGAVQVTAGMRPLLDNLEEQESEIPGRPGGPPADNAQPELQAPGPRPVPEVARPVRAAEIQATPLKAVAKDAEKSGQQPNRAGETRPAAQADAERETRQLEDAAKQLRLAVQKDPALAGLSDHLAIDITPAGLRIQLMDTQNQAMFALGSAQPNEAAHLLLAKLTPLLMRLPEQVSIAGHTDAAPYPGTTMTNWELSTDRANAARRMLISAGLPEQRLRDVIGYADHELLLPADPLAAANRRIAITVLRATPATATQGDPASGP